MSESPCVIYAAKSTKDERGSIPTQHADCRAAAEAEGQTVVGEYKDENASAFKGNRGGDLALAKEHAIRIGAQFWVQHSDRVARGDGITADHLAEVWFALRRHGVRMRSVQDDHNLEDAIRVVLIGERNNEDSKRKAQSVADGLKRRAELRGKTSGGPRPYGYRWHSWLDGSGKRQSELLQVPAEVPVVQRIFDEYLAGRSQKAIALHLNRDGIPSSTNTGWIQATIRKMIANPIYCGSIRHKGEIYQGAHEGIVSQETWEAAQRVASANALRPNNGGGRHPKGNHLFTKGLLRCRCGEAMAPRTSPRAGQTYEVYQCLGRYKDVASCEQLPVRRDLIDTAMMLELDRVYLDLQATRERYAARKQADAGLAAETLRHAHSEALKASERLRRVQRAFQDGYLEPADYAEQRGTLTAEREAAEAAVALAEQRVECTSDEDVTDEFLDRLREVRAAVLGGLDRAPDLNALRRLLRDLFEAVVYWPADRWGEALVIPGTSEGCNVGAHMPAGSAVLVPALKRGAIAGYDGDPLGTQPNVRRAPLDLPAVSEAAGLGR